MNTEVLYQLEQQRLEKFRQDAQLRSLIKPQPFSLRLRTAKTLRQWAHQLSPELEPEFVLAHE
jgi:IS5 family transposase